MARLAPGQGHHGNPGQGRRGGRVEDGGVGRGRHAGRERIAMPEPTHLGVAPLDQMLVPPVSLRPRRALREAVVGRVGVEDQGLGARLLGRVDLDRPMTPTVAGHRDGAADVDPEAGQGGVVLGETVVDVDERRGDGAGARVSDEGGAEAAIGAGRVTGNRRFGKREPAAGGRGHLDRNATGVREPGSILVNGDLEPEATERGREVGRHGQRGRGSGHVGLPSQRRMEGRQRIGRNQAPEPGFDRRRGQEGGAGVPEWRPVGRLGHESRRQQDA